MLIELTTLPLEIQEQIQRIKQGEQIIITDQGKVMTCATVDTQPSYANGDFEFDLERMKQAVEAPTVAVPHFDSDEDFLAWLENLTDADFVERV